MKNPKVSIIAGPCSVDEKNKGQLFDIAQVTTRSPSGINQRAVWGVRCVGIKSRTGLNPERTGMGIDFPVYERNVKRYMEGSDLSTFETLPSIEIAREFIQKTGSAIATEIVDPLMQLPQLQRVIPKNKLFIWNPAVNQLGHPVMTMGHYAVRNEWYVGLKNGKWLGDPYESEMSSMEKTWVGLSSFASLRNEHFLHERTVMIHRGVDVTGKGDHRNLPVHEAARRVKEELSVKLFFDPSHSFGPILRHRIVEETLAALALKVSDDEYLYDGILLEVGDSVTDTAQHITIQEFRGLCESISTFRELRGPGENL